MAAKKTTNTVPKTDATNDNVAETKATVNSTTSCEDPKINEMEARLAALSAQNEALQNMIAQLLAVNSVATTQKNSLTEEVEIVHLIECFDGLKTHIELSTRTLDLVALGETRTLDRREAEEIAGKYRSFFDRGVIAFGSKNEDIAKRFNLKTQTDYSFITNNFATSIAFASLTQLEDLYNKVGDAQKQFMIELFKRKIREGDSRFNDISKIELLERLTRVAGEDHGAMEGVLIDRQTQNRK